MHTIIWVVTDVYCNMTADQRAFLLKKDAEIDFRRRINALMKNGEIVTQTDISEAVENGMFITADDKFAIEIFKVELKT